MTYLEIVNKVLRRLRENEVSTVTETPYSTLIGDFVNDVKREVENAWDWEVLHNEIQIPTVASTEIYNLTGSTQNSRIYDVWNTTQQHPLRYQSKKWFNKIRNASTVEENAPYYYSWEVIDTSTGELVFEVYPTPDAVYTLTFYGYYPETDLTNDTDVTALDGNLLVEGALARAMSERGEAQDYTAQEGKFYARMADLIAIEQTRRLEESTWIRP